MSRKQLKIYFVLGEESGDALGADLLPALMAKGEETGQDVSVVGLAGDSLSALGVKSLFDITDIAVMGFSAVIARLPLIVRRVYQTVADIVAQKPDVIVLIDSPEFTHAVAKRVRRKLPDIPIINYICPSVWAWRSERAAKMTSYVDHILAILPFEPAALEELNGPPATYVGHPLARQVAELPSTKENRQDSDPILLVLPGSRRSELKRMLPPFREALEILRDRGAVFTPVLPAVPHLKDSLASAISDWPVKPQLVDSADNSKTFQSARAALATSGTVGLQLALHRIPMISNYKLDPIAKFFDFLITGWTASLPNLILDRVLVPDEVNDMVIPARMARRLEQLLLDTPERQNQLDGFDQLIEKMKTERPTNELSAEIIFDHLKK